MFRALVMALMIFVNDAWTVIDAPAWMVHFATWEDGMSLADIVYPMFLFAMGMSIPLAIENRLAKGASLWECFTHVLLRTLALLLMGTFIVNSEAGVAWNKGLYWLVMLLGFFLVWNQYKKDFRAARWLRLLGVAVLCGLAIAYRSPDGNLFRSGWWGILGQIGWMYLFSATAYLLCRERKWVLPIIWLALCAVNICSVPLRGGEPLLGRNFIFDFAGALHVGNGHSCIMAIGGLLTTLASADLLKKTPSYRSLFGFSAAIILGGLGFLAHHWFIISKNIGTLPWCLLVSAISVALFTLLRILERKRLTAWFRPLATAGTATLTVYMIPYFFYSFWVFLSPEIPQWLSGGVGALKCALFSALCIAVAWGIGKLGLKLKI